MKKILYVTNTSRMVNMFFIPHINMLLEKGYHVDCACEIIDGHKLKTEKFLDGINFYEVPFRRTPWAFKNIIAFNKLVKLQKQNKYDIIHVHTPISAMVVRMLKIIFPKVKIIYTAHGFHFYKGSSKMSWLVYGNIEKVLARFTDVLITINNEDFEVAKTFKCKDVRKINGVGVDSSSFKELTHDEVIKKRKELGFKENDKIFIIIGEHNSNKNQVMLFEVMDEVNKVVNNAKFICIGDGQDFEANKKIVKEKNLENVFLLGFRSDVNELVNMSDIVLSLSHREGLPKNILEGLAVGKTILASDIRGNNELVETGVNGLLFDVNDNNDLKEKIIDVCNYNEEFFKNSSINSKKIFEKYDLENIKKDLIKVY